MEDVDIPDDPWYLSKFRSFHNHPIDLNLMANRHMISDKDIFRRGV